MCTCELVKSAFSQWFLDVVSLEVRCVASLLGVRADFTRNVAASKALSRAPLQNVCAVAGWPTFIRFYSVDVGSTPESQVLSVHNPYNPSCIYSFVLVYLQPVMQASSQYGGVGIVIPIVPMQ